MNEPFELPEALRREFLAEIREGLGDTKYRELVDAYGEHQVAELLLRARASQVPATPRRSRKSWWLKWRGLIGCVVVLALVVYVWGLEGLGVLLAATIGFIEIYNWTGQDLAIALVLSAVCFGILLAAGALIGACFGST